jgi:hypothetical protein
VVATDGDVALVIEQPVEDMQGFACRRRDHFRVERGIAIGEVRVEFAFGIIAVMGVDAAGAAGPGRTEANDPSGANLHTGMGV